MGLLSNTVSLCPFDVVGDFPAAATSPTERAAWIGEQLQQFAFRSIEHSGEEQALGWVTLDDFQCSEFAGNTDWWRDEYVCFSLRRDQRRLPAALVRAELARAQQRFLAENPTFQRVPKERNEELKEQVRARLLTRVLPTPAVYDVLWHLPSGRLFLCHLAASTLDVATDLFQKTFTGLRLVLVHPLARARQILSADLMHALAAADQAPADASVVEQIERNRWLGWEFLRWLMYQTTQGSSLYAVQRPGPAAGGTAFRAWLDDRLLLAGAVQSGVQKVTVVGPQDNFDEVCSALRQDKQIIEATLHFERGEQAWRLTLKAELFQFGSFRCPAVRLERDGAVENEQLGLFYERLHVLAEGLQLFDSLLLTFLQQRLGPAWPQLCQRVEAWLHPADSAD